MRHDKPGLRQIYVYLPNQRAWFVTLLHACSKCGCRVAGFQNNYQPGVERDKRCQQCSLYHTSGVLNTSIIHIHTVVQARSREMSGFGGVSCGVVVVEERDSRGSSVRRSRRTGTLVHATPRDSGGAVVALELVGDAGTETYMFRRGSCSLFHRFVHQGKLTVCTAGMRHQVTITNRSLSA